MFEELHNVSRILMEVSLRPVQGHRFQPTGFPDLGPAVYERADGTRMLLVESAQSMANRLEQTCLEGGYRLVEDLKTLPYVCAHLTGEADTWTSSLSEAHRLNSPYIITNRDFRAVFLEKTEYRKGAPLNWGKIAAAIFFFDPNSLLHGIFMANLEDGRVKIPRMLSGFIEAEDVREAASGGVKNNPLDPSGKLRALDHDKNVYGNVPYHRIEFTAGRMTAYFNLDLALLRGYGLPPEASTLLIALALYKVQRFLKTGLRLRTACDFVIDDGLIVKEPSSFHVPDEESLLKEIKDMLHKCATNGLFADPPITMLETGTFWSGADESSAGPREEQPAEAEETLVIEGEE